MSLVLDGAGFVLFLTGGAFIFIGGLGALRMPDVYTRMHPAGLTDTMGTILVLTGCLLYSLQMAAIFFILDAADVALTEAAVGAGVATVFLLGALALVSREKRAGTVRGGSGSQSSR